MSGPTGSRPARAAALSAREFPDGLNPVFVRELRRALRAPFHVGGFLLAHGLILVAILAELGMSSLSSSTAAMPQNGPFVPMAVFLAFALILPLGNFSSLQSELGPGRNGELLATSQTSLWSIVTGRVLAATFFGALVLISMVPYLLMRYFLGVVEPVELFHSVGSLLLTNFAMNALVIGVSGFRPVLGRVAALFFLVPNYLSLGPPARFAGGFFWGSFTELLASLFYALVGVGLGFSVLRHLAAPPRPVDPALVLVWGLFVGPLVPGMGFVALQHTGRTAALALLIVLTWILMVSPQKKKLLRPPQRPPLPLR